MRVSLEPGLILRAQPYRDTSLLIEAFSRSRGRVGLVAKGSRGPKSRTRALLQPFTPLLLSWVESGDLGTLTGVETAGAAPMLAGETIFSGWYLNELLLRLTHRHDPHPALFDDYAATLQALAKDPPPALRVFEKRLLAELGYGLLLPEEIDPARRYRYDPESGTIEFEADAPGSVAGTSLMALRDEHFDDEASLRDARRLLRAAIDRQLGGKPLQTPALLRQARALTGSSERS